MCVLFAFFCVSFAIIIWFAINVDKVYYLHIGLVTRSLRLYIESMQQQ